MLVINLVAYFIESFVIVYTFYSIFEKAFDLKSLFLIILTTLLIDFMNYLSLPFILKIGIMVVVYVLYLYLMFHSFQNRFIIYSLCLFILLAVCRVIGNYCATFLSYIPEIKFVKYEYTYASSFVAILFFMVFAFVFHYLISDKEKAKAMNGQLLFGVNVFVLIAMSINLLESVIFINFNIYTIYSLFVEFMILIICNVALYIKLVIHNKNSIKMSQQITRMQYQNQMYGLVNQVKDRLAKEKHKMLYGYMHMKLLLKEDNKEELEDYINQEIERIMKYKYLSSTGNALFDYCMTNKVNQLIDLDIDIKTVFMLNKNNMLLEKESVVYYIMDCLDYMVSLETKKLEIFVNEYQQKYILLKFIVYTESMIYLDDECFLHHNVIKKKLKNEDLYKEVTILME